MGKPKELTREEVIRAAGAFKTTRKPARWRVIVGDRELPARPLVLQAAGVPPNDSTNSHQAVAILESLGFETRYASLSEETTPRLKNSERGEPDGSSGPLLDVFARISRGIPVSAWKRIPADLSKEVDGYLYGSKKEDR